MPQLISTRPFVGRGRTIFTGVGGEFVERKPDGLCGSLVQAQLRAIHGDTSINKAASPMRAAAMRR